MEKNHIFIRDYRVVRRFLRELYLYGCYPKDVLEEKLKIKGRTLDKEFARLIGYLPPDNIQESYYEQKKIKGLMYDRYENSRNYLSNSYFLRTYTDAFIQNYFEILLLLSANGELKESKLMEQMTNNSYDDSTIKRTVKEMVKEGILEKSEKGYQIKKNILEELSAKEKQSLNYALDFFAHYALLSVPTYYLEKNLLLAKERSEESKFVFVRDFLQNILNEEIIFNSFLAINHHRKVILIEKNKKKQEVYPLYILQEFYYGRQYLVYARKENQKIYYATKRLEVIEELKEAGDCEKEEWKIMHSQVEELLGDSWCVNLPGRKKRLSKVKIEFSCIDAPYILNQVERSNPKGKITMLEEGRFIYEIEVADEMEMVPWIRRFGSHAKVLESKRLKEKIEESFKEMAKLYGIIHEN